MLPNVHCLDFEVLLILSGATKPEYFCIGDETVFVRNNLYISGVRSLGKDKGAKAHLTKGDGEQRVGVFRVEFLFARIVAIGLRDSAAEAQMVQESWKSGLFDLMGNFISDTSRVLAKSPTDLDDFRYPEAPSLDCCSTDASVTHTCSPPIEGGVSGS